MNSASFATSRKPEGWVLNPPVNDSKFQIQDFRTGNPAAAANGETSAHLHYPYVVAI